MAIELITAAALGIAIACETSFEPTTSTTSRCEIASGEQHTYSAPEHLRPGWLLVEQENVELIIQVERAAQTVRYHAPGGRFGLEVADLEPDDVVTITPRAAEGAAGAYVLRYLGAGEDPALKSPLSETAAGGREFARETQAGYRAAASHYENALAEWEQLSDDRMVALAHYQIATSLRLIDEYPKALEEFRIAAGLFRALGDEIFIGRSLNGAGLVTLDGVYEIEQALNYFKDAIDHAEAGGDLYVAASATNNVGLAYHHQAKLSDARRYYDRAIELFDQNHNSKDKSFALYNLAVVQGDLGQLALAEQNFNEALELAIDDSNPRAQASVLLNRSNIYAIRGEYQEATEDALEARKLFNAIGTDGLLARADRELGSLYEAIGDYERARDHYGLALQGATLVGSTRVIAESSLRLGRITQDTSTAIELLKDAAKRLDEAGTNSDPVLASRIGFATAKKHLESFERTGNTSSLSQAEALISQVEETVREVDPPIPTLTADVNMARGDVLVAYGVSQRVVTLTPGSDGSAAQAPNSHPVCPTDGLLADACHKFAEAQRVYADRGHVSSKAAAEAAMARVALLDGRVDAARTLARQAIESLNAARSSLLVPEWRASYVAAHRSAVEVLVRAAKSPQESMLQAEHFRTKSFASKDEELAGADEIINSMLAASARLSRTTRDGSEAYKSALEELLGYQAKLDALRKQSPEIDSQRTESQAEALLQSVPAGSAYLSFFIGQSEAYAWWLIGRTDGQPEVVFLELGSYREFERKVLALHEGLRGGPDAPMQTRTDAQDLSDDLLAPIAPWLPEIRAVTMVPDGASWLLPLAALPLPPVEEGYPLAYLRPGDPLIELVPITLRSGLAPDEQTPLNLSRVLAVSNPRYTAGAGPADGDDSDNSRGRELTPISATADEVAVVAAALRDRDAVIKHLTGTEANRGNLLAERDGDPYDVIHIAVHGRPHPRYAALSGLELATYDEQGRPFSPSFLSMRELAGIGEDTDLVVLSGCDTSVGPRVYGGGQFGVARAFLEDGARATVSTLWKIYDGAAIEFAKFFYEALAAGATLEEATRKGQLALLTGRRYADPHYWAPYVLQTAVSPPPAAGL